MNVHVHTCLSVRVVCIDRYPIAHQPRSAPTPSAIGENRPETGKCDRIIQCDFSSSRCRAFLTVWSTDRKNSRVKITASYLRERVYIYLHLWYLMWPGPMYLSSLPVPLHDVYSVHDVTFSRIRNRCAVRALVCALGLSLPL